MEEAELLRLLKIGDQTAFNELVMLFRQKVINTCYRFLLDKEDAEDISQEVFVEVYHSPQTEPKETHFFDWQNASP